jgi:TonB family protein
MTSVMRDGRLIVCAVLSIVGHLALVYGMSRLPRRVEPRSKPATVAIRVVAPPPPPEPPPEPQAPTPPAPRPVPHERPKLRPTSEPPPSTPPPPREAPPPEPTPSDGTSTTPVFGVTMESTSQAGSGPAMPVGNSARPQAKREAAPAAEAAPALAPPVPAYEVTKMPLPQCPLAGRYTDEAKAAAIEGTVVLDLVVGENGRVREVKVVSGLGHGLTAAAVAAIKECHFSPGERDGKPVPVSLRGFKFRFVLPEE